MRAVKYFDFPPIWTVIMLIGQFLAQLAFPNPNLDWIFGHWVWMLPVLIGLIYIVWAKREFDQHRTPMLPRKQPKTLITSGPFRFSRNPIYTGFVLFVLGSALFHGSLIGFVFVPLLMSVIYIRFIATEEAAVLEAFGQHAASWFENTRRW